MSLEQQGKRQILALNKIKYKEKYLQTSFTDLQIHFE